MAETDVKAESSAANDKDTPQDESLEETEDPTGTGEGDESIDKLSEAAQKRIRQLVSKRKEAETVVDWYRQNIGDPNDVVEFRKWKNETLKNAKKDEAEGEITPAKLKQIKDLMRKADPEYAQFLEQQKQEKAERVDAQFDEAEEMVRDFGKSIGISTKDEAAMSRLGRQVMMEIREDPKLARLWNSGNLSCVKKALDSLEKSFLGVIRKSSIKASDSIADKRRISRLPTLPSGSSSSLSTEKRKEGDKGITKDAHKQAWALLQSTRG
jgi:hypothetical protein